MAKVGRPSKYTDEIAKKICDRLAEGDSLITICLDSEMPSRVTVNTWLEKDDKFLVQYACARERQAEFLADECGTISRDESRDMYFDGRSQSDQPNNVPVKRDDLSISTNKWRAAVMYPSKFGLKNQQTLGRLISNTATGMADEILEKSANGDMSFEAANEAMKLVTSKLGIEQGQELIQRLESLEKKTEVL